MEALEIKGVFHHAEKSCENTMCMYNMNIWAFAV